MSKLSKALGHVPVLGTVRRGIQGAAGMVAPYAAFIPGIGPIGAAALNVAAGQGWKGAVSGYLGQSNPLLAGAFNAYTAGQSAQDRMNQYNSLLAGGPKPYNFTPEQKAALLGGADQNISSLMQRRAAQVQSNLGPRGMLESGFAPTEMAGLGNWQDAQRAQARADYVKYGMGIGQQTYGTQVSGGLPMVQIANQQAADVGGAFSNIASAMAAYYAWKRPQISTLPIAGNQGTIYAPTYVPTSTLGYDPYGAP